VRSVAWRGTAKRRKGESALAEKRRQINFGKIQMIPLFCDLKVSVPAAGAALSRWLTGLASASLGFLRGCTHQQNVQILPRHGAQNARNHATAHTLYNSSTVRVPRIWRWWPSRVRSNASWTWSWVCTRGHGAGGVGGRGQRAQAIDESVARSGGDSLSGGGVSGGCMAWKQGEAGVTFSHAVHGHRMHVAGFEYPAAGDDGRLLKCLSSGSRC